VKVGPVVRLNGLRTPENTQLFFDVSEYRVVENEGSLALGLNRSGNLETELSVSLEVFDFNLNMPTNVVFAPGETHTTIRVELRDRSPIWTVRRASRIAAQSGSALAVTEVVVIDNEIPGSLDAKFQPRISNYVSAMSRQEDGRMLLG
jgi:hypothetical protein